MLISAYSLDSSAYALDTSGDEPKEHFMRIKRFKT